MIALFEIVSIYALVPLFVNAIMIGIVFAAIITMIVFARNTYNALWNNV